MRYRLEVLDWPTEGLATARMTHGGIEGSVRHAQGIGSNAWSKEIERSHRQLEAAIDLAEDLFASNGDAIELQPADRMRGNQIHRLPLHAFRTGVNDEGRDAPGSGTRRGPGEHRVEVGVGRVRDEGLGSGQAET